LALQLATMSNGLNVIVDSFGDGRATADVESSQSHPHLSLNPNLRWKHGPSPSMVGGDVPGWSLDPDTNELTLRPAGQTDYWQQSYYRPVISKDDGALLYLSDARSGVDYSITTEFTITARSQFDQAGIMVYYDSHHWIKAGVEVVDQTPQLSAVCTRQGYSDWSTQKLESTAKDSSSTNETKCSCRLRVHVLASRDAVVVEVGNGSDWDFVRIAHLQPPRASDASLAPLIGVYGCCPTAQQGCVINFHSIRIEEGSRFQHSAS
jgi:regulation of enolase protein 1 (concanavalin A-like superfamily)